MLTRFEFLQSQEKPDHHKNVGYCFLHPTLVIAPPNKKKDFLTNASYESHHYCHYHQRSIAAPEEEEWKNTTEKEEERKYGKNSFKKAFPKHTSCIPENFFHNIFHVQKTHS